MSVSEARSSGRLRKRPRISYKEPDDEDLDIAEDGEEEELSRKRPRRINKRKIFRWTDLPGEIRNIIYKLCLSRQHPLFIGISTHGCKQYSPYTCRMKTAVPLIANILLANRATFAEGIPFLYQNEFHFGSTETMYIFLGNLSATSKSWVKGITMGHLGRALCYYSNYGVNSHFGSGYLLPALNSLIGTHRLESLQLDTDIQELNERQLTRFVRCFLQMARKWVDAVGKEKGDKMAFLDLIVLVMEEKAQQNTQRLRLREEFKKWID
ncbi:Short-chain dehydrogenase reductase sdr protein [Neofusicoccum parvum]|nr:Short-chain dehydrogenase reductase sdr protein [Neofusicoccum parvum]